MAASERTPRSVVIVGAGIAGCALADALARRGVEVTVVEQGPLYATGGSTTHAPGLVSRTSPSRLLFRLAERTIRTLSALELEGEPCFLPVGTLEVAASAERLDELRRRASLAEAFGFGAGRMVEPEEIAELHPALSTDGLIGGFTTRQDGIGKALRGAEALARRAQAHGARVVGETPVVGLVREEERVVGVLTPSGAVRADAVVLCGGIWGPTLGALAGLSLPLAAFEHQYALSAPLPSLAPFAAADAALPFVRHQEAGIYLRDDYGRIGIGSFAHRVLPLSQAALTAVAPADRPADRPFTVEDFLAARAAADALVPDLRGAALEHAFNGAFAYTPDGHPLVGPAPGVPGLHLLLALWVTHAVGAGQALAEQLLDGGSEVDLAPADPARFERADLEPEVIAERCGNSYRDTYAIHHPREPSAGPRDVRRTPFDARHRELAAVMGDQGGWERPRWYASNAALAEGLAAPRDPWMARHWSPIAAAEHLRLRERGGLFDMSALRRIELAGHGAEDFLHRFCAGRVRLAPGRATYAVLLDETGALCADITVARVSDDRWLIGGNGPVDAAWLARLAEGRAAVQLRDVTFATACLGVWGPQAPDVLRALAGGRLSDGLPGRYDVCAGEIGGVGVVALGVSYVGEQGCELTCSADDAIPLWAAIEPTARAAGMVPCGRIALESLRLEKGYRAYGADLTREHGPSEAGLGFTLDRGRSDFLGADGLERRAAAPPQHQLVSLAGPLDAPVPGIGEAVWADGRAVGWVTSAESGWSIGGTVALAWIEVGCALEGAAVETTSLGRRSPAVVRRSLA